MLQIWSKIDTNWKIRFTGISVNSNVILASIHEINELRLQNFIFSDQAKISGEFRPVKWTQALFALINLIFLPVTIFFQIFSIYNKWTHAFSRFLYFALNGFGPSVASFIRIGKMLLLPKKLKKNLKIFQLCIVTTWFFGGHFSK